MVLPRVAIATINLGRAGAGHTMQAKIDAAARAGFDGLEMAWECVEYHAKAVGKDASTPSEALKVSCRDIRRMADEAKLEIMALEPFMHYDAKVEWQSRFQEGLLWIELCQILGCKIFQVPTCTYPTRLDMVNTDPSFIASNVQRLADAAAPFGIDIAYEAPAWGLAMDTWQQVDNVIKLTKKSNVKHCLDTFHIAAVVAGDPTSPNTNYVKTDGKSLLEASLKELKESLKPDQISYFQLSDAEAVDLSQKNYPVVDHEQPAYMTWSRNCRIYPGEEKCVLPTIDVCKAVFATGYRGWVSMEVFHVDLYSPDPKIPDEWAKRGMASWKKVIEACGLEQ